MSIDLNTNFNVTSAYQTATNAAASAVVEEKAKAAEGTTATKKQDGFDKTTYKPDLDKVNSMKSDLAGNMAAFKTMVQSLITKQGNAASQASGFSLKNLFENLQVDAATKKAAQEAISEDGEWGVEAVAQRLFDFAQALSGGDPSKAEMLREAVKKGFGAAESAWGGKMPDITGKTYDRVMEMFDNWVNPKEPVAAEE